MGLVHASQNILFQLRSLLSQTKNEDYTLGLDIFSGASIGQHTRHILEFYQCVLNCEKNDLINYDKRARDKRIEESLEDCLFIVDSLIEKLNRDLIDKPLVILGELGGTLNQVNSTLHRELLYAIEHAVHHMAILKIGVITNFTYITIPTNFGVAESTVKYRNTIATK